MDRNRQNYECFEWIKASLSARRAWIEISILPPQSESVLVALRKESVDRNQAADISARRGARVALRKESVDRNAENPMIRVDKISRSPQGERG